MTTSFVLPIATCLAATHVITLEAAQSLVATVLSVSPETTPSRDQLQQLQAQITQALPGTTDHVALVYGGATKIKGYVFEAARLPEIRGASALLDWINTPALTTLWQTEVGRVFQERLQLDAATARQRATDCIVYAGGGNILALAPADMGADLANAIERTYTEHTLTANSAAVWQAWSLLELGHGRQPLAYGVDQFIEDWQHERRRARLAQYYYPPEGVAADDWRDQALQQRYFNRKTFGELVTLLAVQFYRRREEQEDRTGSGGMPRSVPFYPVAPWDVRCDSSGERPAVCDVPTAEGTRPMSKASARKRYVGQVVKREQQRDWYQERFGSDDWQILQGDELEQQSWEQRWETYLDAHPDTPYARQWRAGNRQARPARDLREIGRQSQRYVGLIYADGNNVSRFIATLKTIDVYAAVAHILSDCAEQSVFAALAAHLHPAPIDGEIVHPFEILTIGGDDLLIIVPGNRAFEIALTIGTTFERDITCRLEELDLPALNALKRERIPDRYRSLQSELARRSKDYNPLLGLSAGVVIAQENAPVFFLQKLAEELLKSAKDLARHRADQMQPRDFSGALDFMVMKSITMVTDNIASFRKHALSDVARKDQDAATRRLTARPYTWHEFAGLLTTVRALKDRQVPRSQLYRLREVLYRTRDAGIVAGSLEYLYTRARQKGEQSAALFEHVEQNWRDADQSAAMLGLGTPPWLRMRQGGWESIWPDLVEMYDMVDVNEATPAPAEEAAHG